MHQLVDKCVFARKIQGDESMKITQFSITRYGPLNLQSTYKLGKFNVFYGPNESGKTLTVDALIKLLFQANNKQLIKDFEKIDRVDEKPEGFVVVEENGKESKLPEKGKITELTKLSTSDFRNIFIIRSSDLSISKESEFYNSLTDKLTGVHASEIERLKENLYEIGAITSTGRFQDTSGTKLKTRLDRAQDLIEKIKQIMESWNKKNVATLEKELKTASQDREKLEEMIEKYERVRKYITFKKAKTAIEELKNSIERLEPLQNYTDQRYYEMRELLKTKSDVENQIAESENRLNELKIALNDATKETEQLERQTTELNEKKRIIDEQLRPAMSKIQDQQTEFESKSRSLKTMRNVSITTTILFAILLVTSIFLHSTLGAVVSAVLLALSIAFLSRSATIRSIEKAIQSEIAQLRTIAASINVHVDTLDNLQQELIDFSTTLEETRKQLEDARIKKGTVERQINELTNSIAAHREKLQETVKRLNETMEQLRIQTLEELSQKIEERKQIEKVKNDQIAVLKNLLGDSAGTLDENMKVWDQKISSYVEDSDTEELDKLEREYSDEKLEKAKREKVQIDAKIREDEEKLSKLKFDVHDACIKAREIIEIEEWEYETYEQLEHVQTQLKKFVDDAYQRRDDILFIGEILDEMINEEKANIKQLIDENEVLNDSFRKVTGGTYVKVMYDSNTIKVQLTSGKILTIDKLSSGTYDQLYLCIRLALGKKLFEQRQGDKTGFFILDDPFVKSDIGRIQNQIALLKEFAEMGWQIIYFTSKQEIVELLQQEIDSRTIERFDLQQISL